MQGIWTLARRFLRPYIPAVVAGMLVMAMTAGLNGLAIKRLQPVFGSIFEALPKTAVAEQVHQLDHLGAFLAELKPVFQSISQGLQAAAAEQQASELHRLWVQAIILFMAFAAASAGQGVSTYLASWAGQKILSDIRRALFDRLQYANIRLFERRPVGELIARVGNDTQMLRTTFSGDLANLVVGPMTAIVFLALMVQTSWRLSLLMVVVAPMVLGITRVLGGGVRKHARRAQEAVARIGACIQEALLGARVVRVFGLEETMSRRFEGENLGVVREVLRVERLRSLSRPMSGMGAGIGVVATLVLGGYEILAGRLDPAALMTFVFMAVQAGNSLSKFTQELLTLHNSEGAAIRVVELLDEEIEPPDPPDAVELQDVTGELAFDDVSFEYDAGRPALQDFSLRVAPGEHVAIVGPSGAGKTTVANLSARLYDPNEGAVSVDGADLRGVKRASYRRFLALVPQDTILFSGSVRDNLACSNPSASQQEIEEAARAAQAHEFILALPQGYDTHLSELGRNLSGGQRQRIAIARALLRRPKILILDEATSALDRESEVGVQEALRRLMAGRTTVIIAHRLSTIRDADRIVVMLDGRVVEEGTHDSLLAAGGLYHRLYNAQAQIEQMPAESSEGL